MKDTNYKCTDVEIWQWHWDRQKIHAHTTVHRCACAVGKKIKGCGKICHQVKKWVTVNDSNHQNLLCC